MWPPYPHSIGRFTVRCGRGVRIRGRVRIRQSASDFNKRGNNLAGDQKWAQHCTYEWGGAIKQGRYPFEVGVCLFWWFQMSTLATRNHLPHLYAVDFLFLGMVLVHKSLSSCTDFSPSSIPLVETFAGSYEKSGWEKYDFFQALWGND